MLTKSRLLTVLICVISAASCPAIAHAQQESQLDKAQETKAASSEELIANLQGKWTVMRGKQRWVKEYKGNKEEFKVYNGDSAVYGHSHEIKIETQGLAQICTTSKNEVTIGPSKGTKNNGFSFIIKLEGDKLFEAVGMLEKDNPSGLKPEVIVWERVTE
ncbi:MAG: hypothetical protein KF851_00505 [Pirellulaceae bacterium]|nr:hypothetical protein [Pirellulaceae bacterium]